MKKIIILLAFTISFSVNAQVSAEQTTASGTYSTAIGYNTTASGGASTAMGYNTTASGYESTAMGVFTTASGDESTAMGVFTTASDFGSLVIGQYNLLGSTVTNNSIGFSTENTAFVIGNGANADNRTDALTVLFDGTTNVAGSVTATSFIGDGSQLTNLPSSSPFSLNTTSGNGIQSSTNIASGMYSSAMGYNTTASGMYSTALGYYTEASRDYSTAMGRETEASGSLSTALGYQTTASGYTSTAMGYGTDASRDYSTAMGRETTASGSISTVLGYQTTASDFGSLVIGQYNLLGSTVTNNSTSFSTENTAFVIGNGADADNRTDALTVLFDGTTNVAGSVTATSFIGDGSQLTNLPSSSPFSLNTTSGNGIQSSTNIASGDFSTAIGSFTTASSDSSTAMGYYNEASGDYSIAIGSFTTASGNQSTAIGRESRASDFGSLVIGQYNLLGSTVTNNSTSFSIENTAFVIGNGGNHDDRSDALTVLFDGTTTIAGDLSINSDARLKANIISLGSTLAKVLQIDGKSYTMKKDENNKQKIGVLAQDIEKVFPELVSESNGVKSVNYQGLVPVLINALKEQDAKMNEQQKEIDELKEMVQALVSRE